MRIPDGTDAVEELFPRTKFSPPALDERIVDRPALQERLAAAVEQHPLTVLTAPAGAGKTTAVAQWAAAPGTRRVLWVRLDAADDDAGQLAWALLGCLRSRSPDGGRRLEHILSRASSASTHRLAAAIVNDLADLPGTALVLDDVHALTDADVLALLDLLLDGLHPGNRVVAAARREPGMGLPRLRARGQVGELGFEDLRLDEATIEQVLTQGGTADAGQVAHRMAETTGGWAAAVRLLATRHDPDAGGAVGPADGTEADQHLEQFLLTEVLDRQSADLRAFLVDSAVLDELTPDACAAVTGRADAAQLLDRLPDETLLASRVAAPGEQLVVRCHDLFASFLRRRLALERTSEEVRELHRRAATGTPPAQAVGHLLSAGDLDAAARTVCAIGRAQLEAGDPHLPAAWLERFDPAARGAHPWLDLLDGRAHITRGRMGTARTLLERALAGLQAAGDEEGATRAALGLSEASIGVGDLHTASRLVAEVDTDGLPTALHATVLITRMWHAFSALDWEVIGAELERACDLVLSQADPAADEVLAFGLGSHLLYTDLGPGWLEQRATALLARLRDDRAAAASVHATLAGAALLRADLTGAAAACARAESISLDYGGLGWTDTDIHRVRLGLALAAGDHRAVDVLVEQAVGLMDTQWHLRQQWAVYAYARARSLWVRNRGGEIRDACAELLDLAQPHLRGDQVASRAVVQALAARAEGQAGEAETLLRDAVELHRAARVCLVTGDPEIELASLLLSQGRVLDALDAARRALERLDRMSATGALVSDGPSHKPLLERCAEARVQPRVASEALAALGAAPSPAPVTVPTTGQVLTSREREVLQLVADGGSNRDIAERLFISERTVKSHMTAVLRKLDANSRTHAVAVGREHHLL